MEKNELSIKQIQGEDFISLTEIAKRREGESRPQDVIRAWISNRQTVFFLEEWERVNSTDFKGDGFTTFKSTVFSTLGLVSIRQYIDMVQPFGIISKPGRYGGTFGHIEIALEFASYVSPPFKVRLLNDYKILKQREAKQLGTAWDYGRFLSKVNLSPMQAAIKDHIIPRIGSKEETFAFASEADMLNEIVFGMTAKEYKAANPDAKGNQRDQADNIELTVLSSLESVNTYLITKGASQEARYVALNDFAQYLFGWLEGDLRLRGT